MTGIGSFTCREPEWYELLPAPKAYTLAQDKCVHPRATFRRVYRKLVNSFPEKQLYLKEIAVNRILSVFDFGDEELNSHGKGATRDQAKASAIMEYAERRSWLDYDYRHAPGYTFASYNQLQHKTDLTSVGRTFYIAYSERKEENAEIVRDIPMHWVEAYSLTRKTKTLYPVSWNNNYSSSNGLASGNTKEEAIQQALCEVIERHNVNYWLNDPLNANNVRLIDPESINNALADSIMCAFRESGIDVYLLHTADIPVCTVVACCIDRNPPKEPVRIGYGYGTHTDPQKAILRALTEYAQAREGILKNEDVPDDFQITRGRWQFTLDVDTGSLLSQAQPISCSDLPDWACDDVREETFKLVALLESRGFDSIIVNKTHPRLNIPVYRVFVPGTLPGTGFNTLGEHDEWLVLITMYQGGLRDQAQAFYREHFYSLYRYFDMLYDLVRQIVPLEREDMLRYLNPDSLPLDSVCNDDYVKMLKVGTMLAKRDLDSYAEIFGELY